MSKEGGKEWSDWLGSGTSRLEVLRGLEETAWRWLKEHCWGQRAKVGIKEPRVGMNSAGEQVLMCPEVE